MIKKSLNSSPEFVSVTDINLLYLTAGSEKSIIMRLKLSSVTKLALT